MQLRCFFSTFIAFFSDFVHFTLKLFKDLYYLCTAIQNHRTFIALSSRYHRTHVHVQSTSAHGVSCRCKSSFKITTSKLYYSTSRALLTRLFKIKQNFSSYSKRILRILGNLVHNFKTRLASAGNTMCACGLHVYVCAMVTR